MSAAADREHKTVEDSALSAYAQTLRDKQLYELTRDTVVHLQVLADRLDALTKPRGEGPGA